jgi:hypothetical protein
MRKIFTKENISYAVISILVVCLFLSPLFYTLVTGKAVTFGSSHHTEFGITVCKETIRTTHCSKGCWTSTSYYLVDENGEKLSVSLQIYDSLISVPECEAE